MQNSRFVRVFGNVTFESVMGNAHGWSEHDTISGKSSSREVFIQTTRTKASLGRKRLMSDLWLGRTWWRSSRGKAKVSALHYHKPCFNP